MRKKTKVIIIIMRILIIIVLLIGIYVIFTTEKYTCIIEEIEDEIVIVKHEKIGVRYSFSLDRVFLKMNLESKDRGTNLKVGDISLNSNCTIEIGNKLISKKCEKSL